MSRYLISRGPGRAPSWALWARSPAEAYFYALALCSDPVIRRDER